MALASWQATITDSAGDIQAGATITVKNADSGSLISLYSDRAGTTALSNPTTADSVGFIRFYCASQRVNITATYGTDTVTWTNVEVRAVQSSTTDTTSGALMPVGAFGVGGSVTSSSHVDDMPIGSVINTGLITIDEAVALGLPDLGYTGTNSTWWIIETFGLVNRAAQRATQVFGAGSVYNRRTYFRIQHDTWFDWREQLDSYTVNFNEFLAANAGNNISSKFAVAITSTIIYVPLPRARCSSDSTLTTVGSINLVARNGGSNISGIAASSFTVAYAGARGLFLSYTTTGLTPGWLYQVNGVSAGDGFIIEGTE